MRRLTVLAPATALLLSTAATLGAASGKASGHFRMDKVKSVFVSACAFRVPNDAEDGSPITEVILSSHPLDCAAADATFDPIGAAKAQVKAAKPAFVRFTLGTTVDRIDGNWESTDPEDGFSFGGQGKPEVTVNTATRTEGRYGLAKPEAFFDKTYDFNFTWATDVLAGALAGTPLPKGGGEAGAAYLAYLKAFGAADRTALARLTTGEAAALLPDLKDADFKQAMTFLRKLELQTAVVTGGLAKGDVVALTVNGKTFDKDTMRGRVIMVREGGVWKLSTRKLRVIF